MSVKHRASERAETDTSLRAERRNTDLELARHVVIADQDADEVLRIARERADRLLRAARAAADARLPLSEQTQAAVSLLLQRRDEEDRTLAAERGLADDLLDNERIERRERLSAQLVLERQTTDLHLALERRTADGAVASRDEFLAQASHDLRGLMAVHKIYLTLLAKEAKDHDDRQIAEHVAALVTIEAQMDRMISDLVDVVAIDAGRLSVAPLSHSAREFISSATAVFEPLAREREQTLSMVPAPDDVKIRVDLGRGAQVLGNLLSNAIKFTPPHGRISVGFEASENEVVFFVEDSGPGVPPEQAADLFQRFASSSSAASGLGLGLFIAARIVEAHGGRIWLDGSTDSGCVFRFTLKRA